MVVNQKQNLIFEPRDALRNIATMRDPGDNEMRIKLAKSLWQKSKQWRQYFTNLIRTYDGAASVILTGMLPNEQEENFYNKPRFQQNTLRRLCDDKSFTYNQDVARAGVDQSETDRWRELFWESTPAGLSGGLDEMDPRVWVTGALLVHDFWNKTVQGGEDIEGLDSRWYHPGEYVAFVDPNNPKVPVAVLVLVSVVTRYQAEPDIVSEAEFDTSTQRVATFEYWDDQRMLLIEATSFDDSYESGGDWKAIDGEGWEGEFLHGYGRLPFSVLRNDVSGSDWYSNRVASDSTMQGVTSTNHLYTELSSTTRNERGQPWLTGGLASGTKGLSPNRILELNEGSTFGIAGGGANLNGFQDVIEFLGESMAISNGSLPDTMRLRQSISESGKAILVKWALMQDVVKRRRVAARTWEHDRHVVVSDIIEEETGERLSPFITIRYTDRAPVLTVQDRLAVAAFLLDNHLIGREDVLELVLGHLPDEDLAEMMDRGTQELVASVAAQALVAGRDVDMGMMAESPLDEVDGSTGAEVDSFDRESVAMPEQVGMEAMPIEEVEVPVEEVDVQQVDTSDDVVETTPVGADIQQDNLNGAQFEKLLLSMDRVAEGLQSKEAMILLIRSGFPTIPEDTVIAMVNAVVVLPTGNQPEVAEQVPAVEQTGQG